MSIAASALSNTPFSNTPFSNQPFSNTSHAHYAVVLPGRLVHTQPTTQVYIRRRLLVLAVLVAVVAVVWLGAGSVRATRGGEPAASSTGRPAVTDASYMVQPGDTLWSIAAHHHGTADQADYVDALIQRNGGTIVQVGQVLALP
jgi:hypothetical protein